MEFLGTLNPGFRTWFREDGSTVTAKVRGALRRHYDDPKHPMNSVKQADRARNYLNDFGGPLLYLENFLGPPNPILIIKAPTVGFKFRCVQRLGFRVQGLRSSNTPSV